LKSEEIEDIRIAGLLHDIGKLGIPKNILDKPARLTQEEFEVVKNHPDLAVKIIRKLSALRNISFIVQADQEHWDGRGYPKGLKGEQIPLASRIMLVADAFDAMTSDRAYRKAMPINDALLELRRCSGKDFDPHVAEVACALFKNLNISIPPLEKSF
jgi:HD-GYP domain-containing protein (c-di-GMP phosphodiesterase class II)